MPKIEFQIEMDGPYTSLDINEIEKVDNFNGFAIIILKNGFEYRLGGYKKEDIDDLIHSAR